VVLSSLADLPTVWGRVVIMTIGIYLSILGSLLIALTPENAGALTAAALLAGRVVQGLSAACIMPSTMALVKTLGARLAPGEVHPPAPASRTKPQGTSGHQGLRSYCMVPLR
jgi:MFS family permease